MKPRTAMSGHQSAAAKSDTWLTPLPIIDALGLFDLDPCAAPPPRPWSTAETHWRHEDEPLKKPWFGRVWLNPPFGPKALVTQFMQKMARHNDGIALLPARTETELFFATVWEVAHSILFLRGRPHFHYTDGRRAAFNSGAPICLIGYHWRNTLALRQAVEEGKLAGQIVRLKP